jgi:GNAT superfamily N-acetyltransferase
MDNSARIEDAAMDKAIPKDVSRIKQMVESAYSKYVERLGRLPAPMEADYSRLIETEDMYVLRVNGDAVGAILLLRDGDSIMVDNVVVDPYYQGRGYGRVLMAYAEDKALALGLKAVTLYTNEKMYENITLYAKMGFKETGRKTEHGFRRVFFRKALHDH